MLAGWAPAGNHSRTPPINLGWTNSSVLRRRINKHSHARTHTQTHASSQCTYTRYLSVPDVCRAAQLPLSCWVAAGWANVMCLALYGEIESLFRLISLIPPQRPAMKAARLFLCHCPRLYCDGLSDTFLFVLSLALVSFLRAPEPCAGAGEEGRPVAMWRSGYHVWRRAAVWGALTLPRLMWYDNQYRRCKMPGLKHMKKISYVKYKTNWYLYSFNYFNLHMTFHLCIVGLIQSIHARQYNIANNLALYLHSFFICICTFFGNYYYLV